MPGLLDLPPELIEYIHFAHERLIEAEHKNGIGVAEELGRSRLTCRYFEIATRRGFVEKNFVILIVKAPDDENIQKFCTMASTPNLAAAIRKLHLSFDDDYTMEVAKAGCFPKRLGPDDVATSLQDLKSQLEKKHSEQTQEEDSLLPQEVRVTHAYDNITGAIVPAAYLRHGVALIEAFRACKNVTELWIGNTRLEPERIHRYKRSFRWNMNGPPPEADDDEQDADESQDGDDSTNASGDASEDGEESAGDEEHSESSDGMEGDDEDHGEEVAMPRIETKEVLVTPKSTTTTIQMKAQRTMVSVSKTAEIFCSTSLRHTATQYTLRRKRECVRLGSYLFIGSLKLHMLGRKSA